MLKSPIKIIFYFFLFTLFVSCTTFGLHPTVYISQRGEFSICDGTCKVTLPDGSIYQGELLEGIPHGRGRLLWEDGSRYEGSFEKGALQGEGKLVASNGDRYVGGFVSDAREGEGIFSFVNGSKYTGGFKENTFYGHGILTQTNGNEYVGGFVNNLFHGKGVLYFIDEQGRKRVLAGDWENGIYDTHQEGINEPETVDDLNAEVVLFYQYQMISQLTERIAPSRPGITDLYLVAFGGDASQDVFMKEVLFTKELFEKQYGLKNRTVELINNAEVVFDVPIASVINLKTTLQIISQRMDVEEDILFLYLTSHGSKDHSLTVRLGGVPLANLPAETLGEILKESGIKWKVIAISACYSGGFIDHLKDDTSMIITSSRGDRSSFGCSDDSEMTYFGRAFFQHALDRSTTFVDAFIKAKEIVTQWEDQEDFVHSEPQIYRSSLIEAKLRQWRLTLDRKLVSSKSPDTKLPPSFVK